MTDKTHWLQNPNKNYLGHWDLPSGKDVILTIKSAGWEEVKDPITRKSDSKRVIRFHEKDSWVKPFICNQINAQTITKSTGEKYMEDASGKKIQLGVDITKVKGEEVDCLRVRNVKQKDLEIKTISKKQIEELATISKQVNFGLDQVCKAFGFKEISELPESKFENTKKGLLAKRNANS